jgi:hypothetical protein
MLFTHRVAIAMFALSLVIYSRPAFAQSVAAAGSPDPKEAAKKEEQAKKEQAKAEEKRPNPFANLKNALTTGDSRLTTGMESISASASEPKQHYLMDFMVTAPMTGREVTRRTKPSSTAWFNARFNGSTATSVSGVKQFVGGFESDLVSGDTSALLNTLAFRAGLEFRIKGVGTGFGQHFQFEPVLIAGFGVETVPALAKPAIFEISAEARARWGIADPAIKYIAFTDPDRRRFYRSHEWGVRLKTHHFEECKPQSKPDCSEDNRVNFPGIIDLTLGQDGAITGGSRRGVVGRIDAFYPLPTDNLANAIYLFGAVRTHWLAEVPSEQAPIILRAPSAVVSLPSSEVAIHTLTPDERTRDEWKFGFGLDLVRLLTGASDARDEDEARATREDGSIVTVYSGDEVMVQRRLLQKDDVRVFNHGDDVLLPLNTGTLEAGSIPPRSSEMLTFTAGEPRVIRATARTLKNTTKEPFGFLVMRVLPGEPKDEMGTFTLTEANGTETVLGSDGARYKASRIVCKATCDLVSNTTKNNVLVVVPLKDVKMTIGGVEGSYKAFDVVEVKRKADFKVAEAADLIVLRVR